MRKTCIIAEAGVNHNGSLDLAFQLVDAAARAGADIVKFQTFKAERLVTRRAPKADYQLLTTDKGQSHFDMLKSLELNREMHIKIIEHCKKKGIQFLSTPFDIESLKLLVNELGLILLKISSGEITNAPLLLAAARSGKQIILSTGMSTLGEVEEALEVLAFGYLQAEEKPGSESFKRAYSSREGQRALKEKVALLHCTTEYPALFEDVNLRAMDTLKSAFGLPVGLSDHTPGLTVSIAAAARGAAIIEKHFTIDRNLPGPDHKASLEPEELKMLVQGVREVEKALGDGYKRPAPDEERNKTIIRKSLVAAAPIHKEEMFSEANLTVKRPGGGISPMHYWEWIGRTAAKDYEEDEPISE